MMGWLIAEGLGKMKLNGSGQMLRGRMGMVYHTPSGNIYVHLSRLDSSEMPHPQYVSS